MEWNTASLVFAIFALFFFSLAASIYLYRFFQDLKRKPDDKKDNPLATYTQYVKKKDAPFDDDKAENIDDKNLP